MIVRACGGEAIIQDPETASFASMPRSALEQVPNARVLSLSEIPKAIVGLTREELAIAPETGSGEPEGLPAKETEISEMDMSEIENEDRAGRPSGFACPDRGGVLWEIEQNGFLRFRCRVGHAYTPRNLGAEQRHAVETALWSGLRALEESASMFRRMAERAESHYHQAAQSYQERAEITSSKAKVLRDFLVRVNQGDQDWFVDEP